MESSARRAAVVEHLDQPLTATQLAQRCRLSRSACSRLLSALLNNGLAVCLNPSARRSRVYELTEEGFRLRRAGQRGSIAGVSAAEAALFGWLCFRHRAGVLLVMGRHMQPPEIKRRAQARDPSLRISAGNVRAVLKLLVDRGIALRIIDGASERPLYGLTPLGRQMQARLLTASAGASSGPSPSDTINGDSACRRRTMVISGRGSLRLGSKRQLDRHQPQGWRIAEC